MIASDRPLLTPEHIQFLSTRKLEAIAETPDALDDDGVRWRRIARYELRRRRCEVPVKDRYAAS